MKKQKLYKAFIEKQKSSFDKGYYFESSWYAYAIIEDRALSMLSQTGLIGSLKMLGPKLKALKERMPNDTLLKGALLEGEIITEVNNWKDNRNVLMHQMANGSNSLEEIEDFSKILAQDGLNVVKKICAAARRLKNHKNK